MLGAAQAKPALVWIKGLSLASYSAGVARVKAVEKGLDRMMSPMRCEQVGNLMATLLGRPVRVELDAPPAPPSQGPYANTVTAGASAPPRGASGPGTPGVPGVPGSPTRPANTPPARPANAPPRPAMPPRPSTPGQPVAPTPVNPATNRAAQFQQAMGLPLVKEVMELFDATIIDVRPERKSGNAANPGAGDTADTTAGDENTDLPMESPEPPMADDDEQG